MQVPVLSARGIWIGSKTRVTAFLGLRSGIVDIILSCGLRKKDLWYNDLWNKWLGDRLKFVFSPNVILCGCLVSKHPLTNQHFCQSSSDIKWRMSRTQNETFTFSLMTCVSPRYNPRGWQGIKYQLSSLATLASKTEKTQTAEIPDSLFASRLQTEQPSKVLLDGSSQTDKAGKVC